jgi:PEP-CTERM motif
VPQWQHAFTGDFNSSNVNTGAAANGPDAIANYQGTFAQFLSRENTLHPGLFADDPSLTPANLSNTDLAAILGSYGVDTGGHDVWAVINHNSQFAVVPEPSTIVLAALGMFGLFGYAAGRRRSWDS